MENKRVIHMMFVDKLKDERVIFYYISKQNSTWFERILSLYDIICIKSFKALDELTSCVLKNRNQDVKFVLWIELSAKELIKMFRVFRNEKIDNYLCITNNDYKELLDAYLINYLKKEEINLEEDIIKIGNYKMINFFKEKEYGIEMEDFILPSLFNDMGMLQDGPHEYGPVRLSKGNVVLDCGAHNGAFSMYSLIKGCEVHAFEPVPSTFRRLQRNLSLYQSPYVHMVNKGVWSCTTRQSFYLSDDSATDSAVLSKPGKIEALDVVSIDEYVQANNINRVDFVKADIEGAEKKMLEGMRKTIQKYHPKLSICSYHNPDDPRVLEDLIRFIDNRYVIQHKWKKIYAYF